MNAHELRYCRYLLRCVKDLHIERAAMSTVLDTPRPAHPAVDWRTTTDAMIANAVFRSSVEANLSPLFLRMEAAIRDEVAFAALPGAGAPIAPTDA